MDMERRIIPLAAVAMLATGMLFISSVQAGQISTDYINTYYAKTCSESSVTITSIKEVVGGAVVHNGSVEATECAGMYAIPSDDSASNLSPNIGQEGVGFLNGEEVTFKIPNPVEGATPAYIDTVKGSLDPETFIDPADLQDLDGDGQFTDPGWVHLAHINWGTSTSTGNIEYSSISKDGKTLKLGPIADGGVLDLTFECSTTVAGCHEGSWTLATSWDIASKVTDILGENSFDHLAFVFNGGNGEGLGIYDFNFKQLVSGGLLSGPQDFKFGIPYVFEGTWNTQDLTNNQGGLQNFSHINVWARDPAGAPTNDVPEPATIALFGLGLLGLAGMRKRKMA